MTSAGTPLLGDASVETGATLVAVAEEVGNVVVGVGRGQVPALELIHPNPSRSQRPDSVQATPAPGNQLGWYYSLSDHKYASTGEVRP